MAEEMKLTVRPEEEKKPVLTRLRRIEGQVRGIQKMVEEDRYCIDIIVQINAINAALKQVGYHLLEKHTSHCVKNAIDSGNGEAAMDELMKIMKQLNK